MESSREKKAAKTEAYGEPTEVAQSCSVAEGSYMSLIFKLRKTVLL